MSTKKNVSPISVNFICENVWTLRIATHHPNTLSSDWWIRQLPLKRWWRMRSHQMKFVEELSWRHRQKSHYEKKNTSLRTDIQLNANSTSVIFDNNIFCSTWWFFSQLETRFVQVLFFCIYSIFFALLTLAITCTTPVKITFMLHH